MSKELRASDVETPPARVGGHVSLPLLRGVVDPAMAALDAMKERYAAIDDVAEHYRSVADRLRAERDDLGQAIAAMNRLIAVWTDQP